MTSSPSRLNHAPSDGDTRSEQPTATITCHVYPLFHVICYFLTVFCTYLMMYMNKQCNVIFKFFRMQVLTFDVNDEVMLLLLALR